MATITNSIGSAGGRDYSTPALWEAAIPANIVTAGNSYVGQCYNDSEFVVAGNVVTISGITTDSTHTILLTTGPGQSFMDNANAQTNALRYNASNGVGLRSTLQASRTVIVANNFVSISNLQIQYDGNGNYGSGYPLDFAATNGGSRAGSKVSNCIVATPNSEKATSFFGGGYAGCGVVSNCLFIVQAQTTNNHIVGTSDSVVTFANCTFIKTTGGGSGTYDGIFQSSLTVATNCAFFGLTATFAGTAPTGSNNATDLSSVGFGSANVTSLTYANQFVNTTFTSGDFKIKTGSGMIDAGTTDTTDIPAAIDIVGTSRPQGSAWDIGAWELVSAAAAPAWGFDAGSLFVFAPPPRGAGGVPT